MPDKLDGSALLALLVIGAFAIDRVVHGLLFLLSFQPIWSGAFPDPLLTREGFARVRAEKRQKLIYFAVAITLGIALLWLLGGRGIFYTVGFKQHRLDFFMTLLILVAGSDRIGELVKVSGKSLPDAAARPAPPPIQITGKLTLEEGVLRKIAGQGA